MAKTKKASELIEEVLAVQKERFDVCVRGTTPIILNRLSEKAKHEFLFPAVKKNAAELAVTLKHRPWDEFRASPYTLRDESAPTLISILSTSFKRSIMTAALDLPNTNKAQIGRLTWINGQYVPIYGVPQILLSTVRSADMARTPDIRSRAIIPRWACQLSVTCVNPLIKHQAVIRLLAAAGLFIGVGDWRNEKGSGTFGSFELVTKDDAEYQDIIQHGGREVQRQAMQSPMAYDQETEDLLTWFDAELENRQIKGAA